MAYPIPQPGEPIPLGDFYLVKRMISAVYFLYCRGEVVYVGQSRTLTLRIDQHLEEGLKTFDAVAYADCPVNRLNQVEGHYIRQLAPKYNQCGAAAKARQRDGWKLNLNRRERSRSLLHAPMPPIENLEFVDASECIIAPHQIGEFLGVSDRDLAEWTKAGEVTDSSVLGLLYFAAQNSRKVARAQERFENL